MRSISAFVRSNSANSGVAAPKPGVGGRLMLFAALVAFACMSLSPAISATSPDATAIQLQLARLLFNDGRYAEAFDTFEAVKNTEDPALRREALKGCVQTALRLGDFSHAYADVQILMRIAGHDAEVLSLYGDSLWATGQFEEAEKQYQQSLALLPGNPRGLHGSARSLAAQNKLAEALDVAQVALTASPRDAEIHHTVGSIYEKLHRYRGSRQRIFQLHQPAPEQGQQREGGMGASPGALPARVRQQGAVADRSPVRRASCTPSRSASSTKRSSSEAG